MVDQVPPSEAGNADTFSPLVDVSELPILALAAGTDSAIGRSVRQVIRSLDDPNGVISAFDSFAAGD